MLLLLHLPSHRDDVAYISERVEAFKAAIPDYPAAAYQV